jgi:cytidine deaminase
MLQQRMVDRPTPEIVFGLIGAAGSPLDDVSLALANAMSGAAYEVHDVRLSDLIAEMFAEDVKGLSGHHRAGKLMELGTQLRKRTGLGWAAVGLGMAQIQKLRGGKAPRAAHCYILRSLKHKDEIEALRRIYGRQFIAISVHSPRRMRAERMLQKFALATGGRAADYRAEVEELLSRDEHEAEKLGQRVREAFPLADYFIACTEKLEEQVTRLIDLLFERPIITPTKAEVGMFHAFAASLTSAALGRQVGAAICTRDGDLRAVGFNEVPCAGGGQHWDGLEPDGRDFRAGFDRSDAGKAHALREVIHAFREAGWLAGTVSGQGDDELLHQVLKGDDAQAPRLRDAALLNLTEFTRDVHAETGALLSAARQGIAVRECVLFASTFPCHNCAKHIIAAGIERVVYIEPYAKSYAWEFYSDTISLDEEVAGRIAFLPFSGVAPRRYVDWFQMVAPRKDRLGRTPRWLRVEAVPYFVRFGLDIAYPMREDASQLELKTQLARAEIVDKNSAPTET